MTHLKIAAPLLYLTHSYVLTTCTGAFVVPKGCTCRSQWPRSLRRGITAARLLRLRVRIPPVKWKSVYCDCYVLLGRGFCDELITRPEESCRVWVRRCVWYRHLVNGEALAHVGPQRHRKKRDMHILTRCNVL
jgi:hypothetical protein